MQESKSSIFFHRFKDPDEMSSKAAEWITKWISEKLKTTDRFTWLLSGGNTPKELYALLAKEPFKSKIDWSRLHIFFGDERYVPFTDERNNGRMAYESLLKQVPVPKEQVHYILTDKEPAIAAMEYDKILKQYFPDHRHSFDLSLLGMGEEGHTLSFFPGSPALQEKEKWVVQLYVPSQNMYRITLTPAIVNRSSGIAFLVTGKAKSTALKAVVKGPPQPATYPAQLIKPVSGELHWFMDEAAAAEI